MINEHNLTFGRFDGNAYESSQAAELALNKAILSAEIASYEEFMEIFDKFYADNVEVSSEDSPETIRGKERVRPFLLNFLVPLHVMAEVAGLSISVHQTEVRTGEASEPITRPKAFTAACRAHPSSITKGRRSVWW